MSTLPKLRVRTAHSQYEIDQEAGTYTRTRVHERANDLSVWGLGDGVPVAYAKILSPLEAGARLVITHPDDSWVRSTPIQSVEEL